MMIIRLCPGSVTGLFVLLMAGIHAPARAQDLNQDLRRELAALRAEVERLRAEVDALKGGAAPEGAQPAATLEMMQTQVAELAQVKVESTSRMPVKLFGTIHASVFANSDNPNWLDIPNLALAPPAIGPGGTFTASLRQTRLGFTVDGPTLGSARTSGVVAMDFFGGIPGFQTGQVMAVPRLLVAFARIDGARTALEMGQDHVLLAPRDPTSLAAFAFPLLFRSGNLYLRAPHVRVEHAFARHVRAAAGIVAPIGGDLVGEDYRFVPPALGGERSRRPAVQARIALGTPDPSATRLVNVAASGHYGWERQGAALVESWAGALDFAARRDWIGVAGEVFVGDNIDAFGGALGLNTRASGGWGEIQVFASNFVSFAAGAGLDEVQGPRRTLVPRRRSRTAYGNVIVSLTPEIQASFEYRWLETLVAGPRMNRNRHFDAILAYKF
jgi:hypothetical protein